MKSRFLVGCLAAWLLALVPTIAQASFIGFEIKRGTFALDVMFGLADQELSTKADYAEVADTGRLMFDCLRWVEAHEAELRNKNRTVLVLWDIPERDFDIQLDDDLVVSSVKYKSGKAFTTLTGHLTRILGLPPSTRRLPDTVPLYVVRTPEYLDSNELSDVFSGSIPGYMYAKDSEDYLLLMWQWDPNSALAKELAAKGAKVKKQSINAKSLRAMRGLIE